MICLRRAHSHPKIQIILGKIRKRNQGKARKTREKEIGTSGKGKSGTYRENLETQGIGENRSYPRLVLIEYRSLNMCLSVLYRLGPDQHIVSKFVGESTLQLLESEEMRKSRKMGKTGKSGNLYYSAKTRENPEKWKKGNQTSNIYIVRIFQN